MPAQPYLWLQPLVYPPKIFFLISHIFNYVYFNHVYLLTGVRVSAHESKCPIDQKRALTLLELQLGSCRLAHVGAGNQTRVPAAVPLLDKPSSQPLGAI